MTITLFSQNILIDDNVLYEALRGQLDVHRVESLIKTLQKWNWLTYILIPILYLLKFSALALCLYIAIILIYGNIQFEQLFRIVMLAEIVYLIPAIIKIYWFLLIQPNYSLEDLQYFSPLSLLSLVGYANVPQWSIYPLQLLNIFELIYWLLLAYGLQQVINKPFKTTLGIVAASYGSGLVLWVAFITFLTVSIGS